MNVLLAVDSRHGATREIAGAIARQLESRGLQTTLESADEVIGVRAYDAVVLGSAVYTGHWLLGAKALASREREALAERPVWLFSSGPVGDPPFPPGEPAEAPGLAEILHAREHRVFESRLDRANVGLLERTMVQAARVPEGDFRNWGDIREFADSIADALAPAQGIANGTRAS